MNSALGPAAIILVLACAHGCSHARVPRAPAAPPPAGRAADSAAAVPLTVKDLTSRPVIGYLGVPLGTAVEIRATVVAGRDLGYKEADGKYLLNVTHVGGRALAGPQMFRFWVPGWVRADLAADGFDLYKLRNGRKAGSLNHEQTVELERGYVGKHVILDVYEVGGFSGVPTTLPAGSLIWADSSFGFSTSLEVLVDRSQKSP